MENIIWDSAWNIGHKEIDEQHQKWVEIFNRLQGAVLSNNKENYDKVQQITLKEILEYTRYHFESEENIMKDINYPMAYNHWRMHKDFEKIVYENYRDLEKGEIILNSHLLSLMKNWLLDHIQIQDKKLGCYLGTTDMKNIIF
jgi:hemerythrin